MVAKPAPTTTYVPLESGDRLTRAEFHRRYCARPDIKKAELIEGVVYVASPARVDKHGEPLFAVIGWLAAYTARTPGVRGGDNATVYLDADNEVQPDALLFRHPPAPGDGFLRDDGYFEGPPALVVEVAASSASHDLHAKLNVYRRTGVPEYIVWQVLENRIDWFRLRDGVYVPLTSNARGVIESEEFLGLRLDVARMLAGDTAGVAAELEAGIKQRDRRRTARRRGSDA